MNIRDIITNVGIAVLAVIAFNYFFPTHKEVPVETATMFSVMHDGGVHMPLSYEVDFASEKRAAINPLTEVETSWGLITFSAEGASVDAVEYRYPYVQKEGSLQTIFPKNEAEREHRCFMVGLNKETPFTYVLVDRIDTDDVTLLTYAAESSFARVEKTFTIQKHYCVVDLDLKITPKTENSVIPRIFFPAPVLPALGENNDLAGIVIAKDDSFEKITYKSITETKGWKEPMLFGAENKYFVYALIHDNNHFMQRAYYGLRKEHSLLAVAEGSAIEIPTSWKLSFYFGPKDSDFIDPVDIRLEKTLDYSGILAPISKLILKTLKIIYDYVHNFGFAIIILVFLINLFLLPLSMRGRKRMKEQQEMQRKMAYLQQRYKNDPERL